MDEDFPARIEAVFPNREAAAAAAQSLAQHFEFEKEQLTIVSKDQAAGKVHRNRFAYKASGRRLQKRQLFATLIAFVLIGLGLSLAHVSRGSGLSPGLTVAILSGLVIVAAAITVTGMLSWRPARVETRQPLREGEAALVVHVYDVSEQYALHDALTKMGARVKSGATAAVS